MSKKRIAVIIINLAMLISIASLINGCRSEEIEEEREIAVEVVEAYKGNISQWITLTSQLLPVENVMVFIKTPGLIVTEVGVKLGDRIREGDFLFELDKSIVRQQVEHTKVSYDMAKENYNKQKELLESQQRAMEDIPVSYMGRTINIPGQDNFTPGSNGSAALISARAQVDQAKMAYAGSLRQLSELEYYAPIAGVISQLNVQENQIAINQQPALVITNTTMLKSNIFVSEKLLTDLNVNDEVVVEVDSKSKPGRISLINTVADPRTNLYLVEVVIDNVNNDFHVGNFNRIRFERARRENVILIPKDALLFEGKQVYVFVEEDGRVFKKSVVHGIEEDNLIEIIEGVNVGERIVIRGQQYLKDEMQVKVVRGVDNESI